MEHNGIGMEYNGTGIEYLINNEFDDWRMTG